MTLKYARLHLVRCPDCDLAYVCEHCLQCWRLVVSETQTDIVIGRYSHSSGQLWADDVDRCLMSEDVKIVVCKIR